MQNQKTRNMSKLRSPSEFKFLQETSQLKLIAEGKELRSEYTAALKKIALLEKKMDFKAGMVANKNKKISVLRQKAFHFSVDERQHRLQDIARSFMAAISFGEMSYNMIKHAVFLKFHAFKKDLVTNKRLLHGSIMNDSSRKRFRDAVSRMKGEGYIDVSYKNKAECNYFLTHKGKEEAEAFVKKLQETKLI